MATWKMIAIEIGMLLILIVALFAAVPTFRYLSAVINSRGFLNPDAQVAGPTIGPTPTVFKLAPTATRAILANPATQAPVVIEEKNPRATGAVASFFAVSTEGINFWHDSGFTYADIIRGYTLARMSGRSPKEIFPIKAGGQSWDRIELALCGSTGHYVPTLSEILSGQARKPKPECQSGEEGG